jgi:hypothetical protein
MAKKAYEQLMAEHNLTMEELPEDAKVGIEQINGIDRVISMQEKKAAKAGKQFKVSASVLKKMKAYDKWVVAEILDYVDDKDTNTDAPDVTAAEIIHEIKDEAPKVDEPPVADAKAEKVDAELEELHKSGKLELTLDEIKSSAPTTYSIIFDGYEKDGQNGITTTFYSLIESGEKFTLTKK